MSKKILLPALLALSSLVSSTYAFEKSKSVQHGAGQVKETQSMSKNDENLTPPLKFS